MRKIQVLHIMGPLRPSGMERMFVSAAPYFNKNGIDGVILGQGSIHPFAEELRNAGYKVSTIPSLRSIKGLWALRSAFRSYRPDVVHIHAESAFAASTLLAKACTRAPIVRTVHNVFRPVGKARLSRVLQGFLADRFIAKFIAPSPDVANNERLFGRSPVTILNWVADEYNREGSMSNSKLAVIVGNCSQIKNHEMALHSLVKNGYKVAHHGDERTASAVELGLLNALEERGDLVSRGTSAPLHSLKQAGVFVMPSLHEGMPVAFAEALASGVACLVADSPGLAWARDTDAVEHIQLTQEDWDNSLPESGYVRQIGQNPTPDFTAERGAQDYASLYFSIQGEGFKSAKVAGTDSR